MSQADSAQSKPERIAADLFRLCSEAAINKRLVRARQRSRELDLPFAVPSPADLPERLAGVLRTLKPPRATLSASTTSKPGSPPATASPRMMLRPTGRASSRFTIHLSS